MKLLALATVDGRIIQPLARAEDFDFDPNQPRDEAGRWTKEFMSEADARNAVHGTVVTDEAGRPIKMFHGSQYEFDQFNPDRRENDIDAPFTGIWFTSDEAEASPAMTNPKYTYEAYLDVKNPAPTEVWRKAYQMASEGDLPEVRTGNDMRRYLLRKGYDGIVWDDVPKVDRAELSSTGQTSFSTARGAKMRLERNAEYGGVDLYDRNGFVTGYENVDQFLSQNAKTIVAFTPQQVKLVRRRPSKWGTGKAEKTFALRQKLFSAESIIAQLDALEAMSKAQLREVFTEMRESMTSTVRKAQEAGHVNEKWIGDLKLRRRAELQLAVQEALRRAYEGGQQAAKSELLNSIQMEAEFDSTPFAPRSALRWLNARAVQISGVLSDKLLSDSKGILLTALKTGAALDVTMERLYDIFVPFLGDEVEEAVVSPWRLENIVRTNTTEAYNHGRLTEFRNPGIQRFMQGVRYQAIMDQRTTDVCRFLDGKVFHTESPDLPGLLPPNHFQCRSIVTPIVVGQALSASDFITTAEVARARELADQKFLEETQQSAESNEMKD